jgi:hypothetical protein
VAHARRIGEGALWIDPQSGGVVPPEIDAEARAKLCVVYQVDVNARTQIIFVRKEPIRSSGDPRFDESARMMLEKAKDDGAVLPRPPTPFVHDGFFTLRVALPGGPGATCG